MQPDAVLAAAGALHVDRALHQFVIELLGQLALGRDHRVDEVGDVEVAVTDMTDDVVLHASGSRSFRSCRHALGQLRDRHTGIGAHGAATWLHLRTGKVGVVTRGPELGALFRRRRPLEAGAAELVGDLLNRRGLFGHARRAAVELHQQHGRFGQRELVVAVHRAHRVRIEQLAACDRDAHLDDLDRRADGSVDAREGAGRRRNGLRQRVQPQCDLGHHAERALAADHQARQVVARR